MRLTPLLLMTSAAAATALVVNRCRATCPISVEVENSTFIAAPSQPHGRIRGKQAVKQAFAAVGRGLHQARRLVCFAVFEVPLVSVLLWNLALAESTGGRCSLIAAYALVAAAIAALGTASVLAAIFFNIPGLVVAIGLVVTVSFVLIPQIKAAIEAYDACKGPSRSCRLDLSMNTLGQAAMLIAVAAWTVALILQILAVAHFATWFLAWLGALELGTSEVLKWGGVASNVAAAGVLVGFLTQLAVYESCRNRESVSPAMAPVR